MPTIPDIVTTQLPHIPDYIGAVVGWLFGTVIMKYMVAHYIAERIKKYLTNRRLDAITWEHYRQKARGHGHRSVNAEDCSDGLCHLIRKVQSVHTADTNKSISMTAQDQHQN